MERVCPNPPVWNRIYQRLKAHWESLERRADEPPFPLILNGWVFSSDLDKQQRWDATVRWASEQGASNLIPELRDENWYSVEILSTTYDPGPSYSYHEPSPRPADDEAEAAFKRLSDQWPSVGSPEFTSATQPLEFSGDKLRRLLAWADEGIVPPWGTWTEIDPFHADAFTSFRARVNAIIAPLHVDHIDFTLSEAKRNHITDTANKRMESND